jgi:hypothetical protein
LTGGPGGYFAECSLRMTEAVLFGRNFRELPAVPLYWQQSR